MAAPPGGLGTVGTVLRRRLTRGLLLALDIAEC